MSEEQVCEIILNLHQWSRYNLKYFLLRALEALLFCGAEQFMQFQYRALWETFMSNYFKFGSVVQEMSFKEKVYCWTIIDHNSSP